MRSRFRACAVNDRSVERSIPGRDISPIREEMAQEVGVARNYSTEWYTHRIFEEDEFLMDSRDKPDRVNSVRYAG